ncbi:immunoglobulin-like protein involved in spore germination [Sinobaca qinghaiensis]|uniref:Immunoglobulin-like protein involved in spore germination n=1 Tax=Sinobaca qinghaiensis TaxID=342944 RepID=A0A419UX25_9BACL|nr:Gmad2 immunoglobulin-like domain-containing protein [Sinobaca qinghaiensis]RKD69664.1 immunoglobulin-like protein involved in spore germination [Sinobaca qinghaiensis]
MNKLLLTVMVLFICSLFVLPAGAATETMYENDSFRIHSVESDGSTILIEGEARVFEATVSYVVEEDGREIDEGFTTATTAGPDWGEFDLEIDVAQLDEGETRDLTVIIFSESADDGSRMDELEIPVTIGEDGGPLPATSTFYPAAMLLGVIIFITGTFLLFRRRATN